MVVDGTVALSIFSLAHQLYKDAQLLIETYESYQSADEEIKEAIVQIQLYWADLRRKVDELESSWISVDEGIQRLYEQALQILYGKLQASITIANSLVKESKKKPAIESPQASPTITKGLVQEYEKNSFLGNFKIGESRKLSYAIRIKENLQSSIQDLKVWSELYSISTLLVKGSKKRALDQKIEAHPAEPRDESTLTLNSIRGVISSSATSTAENPSPSLFLPLNDVSSRKIAVPYSKLEIWENIKGIRDFQGTLVVDETLESRMDTLSQVRNLARLLKTGNQYGIFPCERIFKRPVGSIIECRFAFLIPETFYLPRSLRYILLKKEQHRELNEKITIAKQLGKAVLFVHSAGFVHKNIRPETILIMQEKSSSARYPFLVGFERFRLDGGRTTHEGDTVWEKNLYRHPERQGLSPENDYIMQHDIYSLGVCLLEIGLGISFTAYKDQNGSEEAYPTLPELKAEVNSKAKQDQREKAHKVKNCLVEIAKQQLPSKVGRKFTDIVVTCLTCLDQTGNKFGLEADYRDQDGILVGVRYIEKIFFALQDISV